MKLIKAVRKTKKADSSFSDATRFLSAAEELSLNLLYKSGDFTGFIKDNKGKISERDKKVLDTQLNIIVQRINKAKIFFDDASKSF